MVEKYSNGEDFLADFKKGLSFIPDILIIDYNLSDMNGLELLAEIKESQHPFESIIVSGQSELEVVIESYDKGAGRYIIKNTNCIPEVKNAVEKAAAMINLRREVDELKSNKPTRSKYKALIGESAALINILNLIERAERSNILVLITGESGTGKELVARAIHENSQRNRQPFVPINMAAIPKDLIESELFGHEKGAFTGAVTKRIGKFEEADQGTIFLDEIGEMDLALQTKLLRILEDKEVIRVGSNKPLKLDIRIIVATNSDLIRKVEDGEFREDLYYRLQGFLLDLPPLRERKDDILILANHFIIEFSKSNSIECPELSKETMVQLMDYNWPGNIRELKSGVERATLMCNNNVIIPADLMLRSKSKETFNFNNDLSMEEHKMKIIDAYLVKYDNNIDKVVEKLAIGRATLYRMMKRISEKSA